ncbi:unnamed protein product [Caenorhabditis nigoni]
MKESVKRTTMRSLAKTQSEHDSLVKKNVKVFVPSELNKGIYETERCRLCTDNLFNFIPLISTYTSKDPRTGKAINNHTASSVSRDSKTGKGAECIPVTQWRT